MESPSYAILEQTFNLAGKHSQESQFYKMESKITAIAADGTCSGTDIYKLKMKCSLKQINGVDELTYTCLGFTVKIGESPEFAIPALDSWTYTFKLRDEQGNLFGIDKSKFENLKDEHGNLLPLDKSYPVYTTFIDFHSLCNIFSEGTTIGNGIQNLTKIGQKIVHASAFIDSPVMNIGATGKEGSHFKNGEVTLEFKGLGLYNKKPCAIIGYDSGACSFAMSMVPAPGIEVKTIGSSHYRGDIHKHLVSNWVEKAELVENGVMETVLPAPPNKVNSIIERQIMVQNIKESEL